MTPDTGGDSRRHPTVSVIIPCKDGEATVGAQLRALLRQSAPVAFEILVCDNGSTDGTARVVDDYSVAANGVRLIDASDAVGINHARNVGLSEARGELMLFCDADDVVQPGWLAGHWRAYRGGADVLAGRCIRVGPGGQRFGETGWNDTLNFLPWATGANFGISRAVLEKCGLMDETYRGGGDETEYCWRAQLAGFELAFVPDARIDYRQRDDARSAFRQGLGYGRSHVRLYVAYNPSGMRRPSVAKGVLSTGRAVARTALALMTRSDTLPQRMKELGIKVGRIRESVKSRRLFI
ncbi:glycosyltransferase family 2 protein [Georgenia deserti]|uniref:Glycosyltransferase family 2 protein n=1 Tax=Georgenia deserti TaxID=2093781 RepID=A0ABW4L188_9MICO